MCTIDNFIRTVWAAWKVANFTLPFSKGEKKELHLIMPCLYKFIIPSKLKEKILQKTRLWRHMWTGFMLRIYTPSHTLPRYNFKFVHQTWNNGRKFRHQGKKIIEEINKWRDNINTRLKISFLPKTFSRIINQLLLLPSFWPITI